MVVYVLCSCCGQRIPASEADLGRAVVCPTSRRLVMVNEGSLLTDHSSVTPMQRQRRRPLAIALAMLLILAGLAAYLAWDQPLGKDQGPAADPGAASSTAAASTDSTTNGSQPVAGDTAKGTALVVGQESNATTASTSVVIRPEASAPGGSTANPGSNTTPTTPGPSPALSIAGSGTPTRDQRGMTVHQLGKRIDLRTAEELLKELLGFREVALDTPALPRTSQLLLQIGQRNRAAGIPYPSTAVAAKDREDLAGMPFLFGADAVLFRTQAESLDALSRRLRSIIQACTDSSDPRPDPDKLYAALLSGDQGLFRDRKWATADAVPCIQQMLQAERVDVRRMCVELLRGIDDPAATEALVRWAVFDTAAPNRAAAVDALKRRDATVVTNLLLKYVRYPWPRAVEHAAEALVTLNSRSAVPTLAAILSLPAPDSPHAAGVPGETRLFRPEVVRVNHPRNCLMCHPPSATREDLVRGAIPDPSRPLAAGISSYNGGEHFVHASTTYLRQDFSCVLPVANPGVWTDQQRFDFMVTVRPMRNGEATSEDPAYRGAVLFALRELSEQDLGTTATDWETVRNGQAPPGDGLFLEVARFLALFSNPDPLLLLSLDGFGPSFFTLTEAERDVIFARLSKRFGADNARRAIFAILLRAELSDDPAIRETARSMLLRFRTKGIDSVAIDAAAAAKMLRHANPQVRAAGAGGIVSLGKNAKDYLQELLNMLKDADPDVRAAVAAAIGELPSAPDAVYLALAKATLDSSGRVRTAAAASLVQLKYVHVSAATLLAEGLLRKGDWSSQEDRVAFEKLLAGLLEEMNQAGKPAYSIILKAATGATPTNVPAATLAKLLRITASPKKDELGELVRLLANHAFRTVAEEQLLAAGDASVPLLIDVLKDESEKLRLAAVEVLGRAATMNRKPPPARTTWWAANDALAVVKVRDLSGDVRRAAETALKNLTGPDQ